MNNKFSSLLLSLLLMGSLPALADTTDATIDGDATVSPRMTAEELQEIKEICASIADESGLEDEARSEYIQECIDAETMMPEEPEGEASDDGMTDEATEGDDMTDEETSESNES